MIRELVRTPRGNRYILVIVYRFTKLVKSVPLKNISAISVARAFVTHWVFNFGPPTYLISNNGKQFTSKFFLDVCCIMKIHNAFTKNDDPQTNGRVKRFNRTILYALRTYIGDHPHNWDLYAPRLHTCITVNLKRRQGTRNLNWCYQNHQDRFPYRRNSPSNHGS